MEKTSSVIEERRKKIEDLREMGINPFPAGYDYDITASQAIERFRHLEPEVLEKESETFSMAGRIMSIRGFGKASFIHIKDGTGQIQSYIRKDRVGEKQHELFRHMDIGDFIGIRGSFFKTSSDIGLTRFDSLC